MILMRGIVLLLTICFLFSSFAFAVDIGEVGIGARSIGTGRAYVGGVDDATAIFTNPAGIALNDNLNLTSMNGNLFGDVKYLVLGAADNSPVGRMGIGFVNASTGGIPITTITGSGSTETIVQTGSTDYSSSIIFFTYATKLGRILRGRGNNISFGANLKYFFKGFSGGGTVMQDAYGVGMDADLGLLWDVNPWAKVGFALHNFLPYELGGRFIWQKNNQTESNPMLTRLGCGIKMMGREAVYYSDEQELILLVDYEEKRESNRPAVWHAGLEFWPVDMLAFRAGMERAVQSGVVTDNNFTAGIGTKYMGFVFDYAYHQVGDLSENATHFFSIGYRGLDPVKPAIIKKVEEKPKRPVIIAQVALKPALAAFTDLADDYWAKMPIEYLATLGIMGGYPDGTFRPDQEVTRGELAAILVNAKGEVARKYISGYPDGTFRSNQKISRAEAAVVFSKFAGLYVKPQIERSIYEDVETGHWAAPAISASTTEGFFEYISDTKFSPKKFLTRAEVAEILSKTAFVKEKIETLISGEQL